MKIGIFFGSDTGSTERVALAIQAALKPFFSEVYDVATVNLQEAVVPYDVLLLGISTWHYGELQCDWDQALPQLIRANLSGKRVGLFGCGDQEDYAQFYCNALGTLHHILKPLSCQRIGIWNAEGYIYKKSTAQLPDGRLVGLALDEDRQAELTQGRVTQWVAQIKTEIQTR